jgi:hypothetical protein
MRTVLRSDPAIDVVPFRVRGVFCSDPAVRGLLRATPSFQFQPQRPPRGGGFAF